MDLRLEAELSKTELTAHIDLLKNQIDQLRPLSQEIEDKVMQKLRLEWNYHSNAIEGNRLNYGETVAFLMTGITAKGKSLKDHLDIRGHNEAILFLLSIVKDERDFTESDIRALHEMILVEPYDSPAQTADGISTKKRITLGEYKSSSNHVKTITGETHFYASPEETPAKMQELMEWYKAASQNKEIHPLILAALFHYKFVAIHPFDDGNGRLSPILMNLILMRNGYPPIVIKLEDRQNYYALLSHADTGNYWPFIEYIGDYLATSLNLYLKAIEGGNIDEPEDIDKDIALCKLELKNREPIKESVFEVRKRIVITEIEPLFKKLIQKISQFEDLFLINFYLLNYNTNYHHVGYTLNKLEEIMNSSIREVESDFTLSINFEKYKSEVKSSSFSVFELITVIFNDNNYLIYDGSLNAILERNFDEKINQKDQYYFIKHVVNNIKNSIQENF